jgi:hypothetical protein
MALLRIRKQPDISVRLESMDGEAVTKNADEYLDRLLKLIPSDVVGIYLIGRQISDAQNATHWWAFICLALVIVIRIIATRESKNPSKNNNQGLNSLSGIQWPTVFISSFSFIIWVYTLGDYLPWLNFIPSWTASLALLVWTVLVPYLYKGDTGSN